MTGESLGMNVNVRIREIDRITGLIRNSITGHNRITETGLRFLADYISAHFNSGQILDLTDRQINENIENLINDFKVLVSNLPYSVCIGNNSSLEQYSDIGVKSPIEDPKTKKPIEFKLSDGASTIQSALLGSLQSASIDNYEQGITISYTTLSDSTTFENFNTNANGVIVDDHDQLIKLTELALMSKNGKCWARIAFAENDGLILNKNRVYDILWNINLVSIPTQLKELNG